MMSQTKDLSAFFLKLSESISRPNLKFHLTVISLILALNALGAAVVYMTGGTKLSYIHIMYVPIILSGFFYGPWVGTLSGIFSAFVVGPFMPEHVELHLDQQPETWFFRLVFFAGIGGFAGAFSQLVLRYAQNLERQYLTDPATNLPNFRGLERLIQSEGASFYGHTIVVKVKQLGDIDHAFGPASAETLLKKIGQKLIQTIGEQGVVGRIGGPKFAILLKPETDVAQILYDCHETFSVDLKVNNVPIFCEIFYGVAHKDDGDDLNAQVRKASAAVDRSVITNEIHQDYESTLDDKAERNIFMLRELRQAIAQETLSLHYQPIMDIKTETVVGVEALARWNHPELGSISPLEFTGLAEKSMLINPYTKWLIRKALGQLAIWREQNFDIMMSLNFSMKNFQDPSVIEELFKQLNHFNIPPESIEIEVTETEIAANIQQTADILKTLQDRKIKIAVDDFGTGQSALSYLFELPVNYLKIDRVFITAMVTNSAAEAIVRSAILLGHELNLKIIAEGIETEEQFKTLKKIGCDYAQGYLIAKPMAPEMLNSWFETKERQVAKRATGFID